MLLVTIVLPSHVMLRPFKEYITLTLIYVQNYNIIMPILYWESAINAKGLNLGTC